MRIWANESAAAGFSLPPSPGAAPRAALCRPERSRPGPPPAEGEAERCGGGRASALLFSARHPLCGRAVFIHSRLE